MARFISNIENIWRDHVVYPLLKMFLSNPSIDMPLDISKIHKILIIRNDRIGDMIVTTPVLRELKRLRSDLQICILASPENVILIKDNKYIDNIYIFTPNIMQLIGLIKNIRRDKYDLVINFVFTDMTMRGLLINLAAPKAIKIGQGDDKYKYFYNHLLKLDRHIDPMPVLLMNIIKAVFGADADRPNYKYEIFIDQCSSEKIRSFLNNNHLRKRNSDSEKCIPYLIFNISVNDRKRRFSVVQIKAILNCLIDYTSFMTVIIHAPNDCNIIKIKEEYSKHNKYIIFPESGNASLIEIASLIEGAAAVITPDTSIIHFSAAYKTPVIGFYGTLLHEWAPYDVKNKMIVAEHDQMVSDIATNNIINIINDFIKTEFPEIYRNRAESIL